MNLTDRLSNAGHATLGVTKQVGYYTVAMPAVTFLLPRKYSMPALDGLAKRLGIEDFTYDGTGTETLWTSLSILAVTASALVPFTLAFILPRVRGEDTHFTDTTGGLTAVIYGGYVIGDLFYRDFANKVTGKAVPTMPVHVAYCIWEAAGKLSRGLRGNGKASGTANSTS